MKLENGTVHILPDDMRKTIAGDKKMQQLWASFTPLARNEWICWVTTVKQEATRVKHLKVMKDKMHKGERRPCCWVGCIHRTDKAMSPTQKWVTNRQKTSR